MAVADPFSSASRLIFPVSIRMLSIENKFN
jgi:hypothetical protein